MPTTHMDCMEENIIYVKELEAKRCLVRKEVKTDYRCRYSVLERLSCYCCGEIFFFIEQGSICTRFCKEPMESQEPRVGQQPIIQLPFSWGEEPSRVELEERDK